MPGFNVAGYFHASHGVGQAGRSLLAGIEATGLPFSTWSFQAESSPNQVRFEERGPRDFPFDLNVLCINADQTPVFAQHAGPAFFEGRHNIGLWFWEVEVFPPSMLASEEHLDEIWVASEFTRRALSRVSRRPVFKIPLPIVVPSLPSTHLRREDLGLPEGFLFLYCFDFRSVVGRKNPQALIEAFKRAFSPSDPACLVVKSTDGHAHADQLARLKEQSSSHPNIHFLDQRVSQTELQALIALCDSYVSLHRAEGLGLTVAEAMARGKPVISTAFSGTMEFTTPQNSLLVPYRPTPVGEGNAPYLPSSIWADPDVPVAADMMRSVFDNPLFAQDLGQRARSDMAQHHGVDKTRAFIRERLEAIRMSRSRVPPSPRGFLREFHP